MKHDLVRPCPRCPFRADVPGYLRRGRAVEIASAVAGGATFACHRTTKEIEAWEGDGEELVATRDSQQCAGALIAQEHMGILNQAARMAENLGVYDASKLDMSAPVVKSLAEFVDHHGEDEEEQECCSVCDPGCEAPAGMLINGFAVPSEVEVELGECPVCGEPICESCSGPGGKCPSCHACDEGENDDE